MKFVKRLLLKMWRWCPLPTPLRKFALYLINVKYIVGVLALVTDESGRILLFKHTYFPENPWGIPGGAAKDEDLEEALRREMKEESGYSLRIDHCVGIAQWDRRKIDFLFACSIEDGQFANTDGEVADFGYFQIDDLPPVQPHHRAMLKEMVRVTGSPSRLDISASGLFMSLRAMNGPHE